MSDWLADALAVPGFVQEDELRWLHEQASRFETVVEIGTWKGCTARALGASGARVWTVDHFQGSPGERTGAHAEALVSDLEAEAQRNLADLPNVTILRKPSLQASRLFTDGSIDMVFIDGDHELEAVLIDLIAWRPKARRLLCGHDRDWQGPSHALALVGVPFEGGPGSIWFTELIR